MFTPSPGKFRWIKLVNYVKHCQEGDVASQDVFSRVNKVSSCQLRWVLRTTTRQAAERIENRQQDFKKIMMLCFLMQIEIDLYSKYLKLELFCTTFQKQLEWFIVLTVYCPWNLLVFFCVYLPPSWDCLPQIWRAGKIGLGRTILL